MRIFNSCLIAVVLLLNHWVVVCAKPPAEIELIEIDDPQTAITLPKLELLSATPTFPEHAILFIHGVALSSRWDDKEKLHLKSAIEQLRLLNKEIPDASELRDTVAKHPELFKFTKLEKISPEDYARFLAERNVSLQEEGYKIDYVEQHRETWKIINSLRTQVRNFDKFKSAFLLSFVSRCGISVLKDPEVKRNLELDQDTWNAVVSIAHSQRELTAIEIRDAKETAIKEVWRQLRVSQQQKICGLLGTTEDQLLASYKSADFKSVSSHMLTHNLMAMVMRSDSIMRLLRSPIYLKILKESALSPEELKTVSLLIEKATKNLGPDPRVWLTSSLRSHIATTLRDAAWKINGELDPSLAHDARKKLNALAVEVERLPLNLPTTKMTYHLGEPEIDGSTEIDIRSNLHVYADNFIIFRIGAPKFPEAEKNAEPVLQYVELNELAQSWTQERQKAKNIDDMIRINNQFLDETQKVMLPFQYKETFVSFFQRTGLVSIFHYPAVAREFGVTKQQQNEMAEAGVKSVLQLEEALHVIKEKEFIAPLKPLNDQQVKALEKMMGISLKDFGELTKFGKPIRESIPFTRIKNGLSPSRLGFDF